MLSADTWAEFPAEGGLLDDLKADHIGGPLVRPSTLLALQRAAFQPGTYPYLVPFLPPH